MTTSSDGRPLPRVNLMLAGDSADLVRYAAEELKRLLERLFDVEAQISAQPDEHATAEIVIGRLEQLTGVAGESWPTLSDQGFVLRQVGEQRMLLIGGGSDVATLWAVYELGERLGVRYLHYRDVIPARRTWSGLPPLDVVMEPDLRIRCWRLASELPHGPISWSIEENYRFLRQMAKMKFNRVRIQLWPAQPFIHYTICGLAKPKGTIYFGHRFPIDDDTVGREHFGKLTEFTNPHFVGAETSEELHRRAVRLLRDILAEAQRLGMQTELVINAAEWPKEFQRVLHGTEAVQQVGYLTSGPGSNQSMDDPVLREAAATVIKACVETYPDIDYLVLSVPEHGHWTGHAEEAFEKLVKTHHVKEIDSFEDLCAKARSRSDFPDGGERVERQVKSDLSSVWFLDSLVREHRLLQRPGGGPDIKLMYSNIAGELFPLVSQVVPAGGEVASFVDYTASRQLQRREMMQHVPPPHVPASVIFTLADDNVGVLPQLATGSLHQLIAILREYQWSGYSTRYWTIGDLDPTIHMLARCSWDRSLTLNDAYADQVRHTCGESAVQPALEAFAIIEKITLRLDQYGLGFGFIVPGMMTQHYEMGGLSKEIQNDRRSYVEALRLMEQAHAASSAEGRDYTGYFVSRLRFAVCYLDAAESFGATARALQQGDQHEALKHADWAYASVREALQVYADVARDQGDLGAVAAMNEYCYRPIRDKRDEIRAQIVPRVSFGPGTQIGHPTPR